MGENKVKSCLRNEKVIVRFVPKEGGMVTNPNHVLYGGLAEGSVRYYTAPIMSSTGSYKNILTNDEKEYLEDVMGLEYNALSIYKKEDNFWNNLRVRLTKQDTILDLSNPSDYIKYKVLLANTDLVADSLETLQDKPRATYEFVLIKDGEQEDRDGEKMNVIMKCYREFGKIENDVDILKCIIELLDQRPLAANTKHEYLKSKVNTLIQADANRFYKTITDDTLPTKVLIKKAIEKGLIAKRGNFYYLKRDNSPLCNNNEDPTLTNAARYLALPKNQEIKLYIETAINSENK